MAHIFISYSKKDIAFARHLRSLLQDAGFAVWMDETKLVPSEKWWPTIEQNIQTCSAFIVVMSPDAKESNWVEREILVAENKKHKKPIFPVLLAGEAWSRLGEKQFEDMTAGLAATLTPRLVSGLSRYAASDGKQPVPPPLPIEKAPVVPTPQSPQERYDKATRLIEAGDYEEAIPLLEALIASGYRPFGDIQAMLDEAKRLFKPVLRRREAQGAYDELVMFVRAARSTAMQQQAHKALVQFQKTYPEFGYPTKLAEKLPPFSLPMLEWCDIPAGRVTIGNAVHTVEAFKMAKYPVTNEQFQVFIDAPDGYCDLDWWDFSEAAHDWRQANKAVEPHFKGNKLPRENVCWYEAMAFCCWLSAQTGLSISLPTKMQWQRASQADDEREYPWGNDFDKTKCNTGESGVGQTTPVDQYPQGASPYGVLDMSGNVWEWCLDRDGVLKDLSTDSVKKVVQGGSWDYDADYARAANRYDWFPGDRGSNGGFRVAAVGERPFSLTDH